MHPIDEDRFYTQILRYLHKPFTYDKANDLLVFNAGLKIKPHALYLGDQFHLSNGIQAVSYTLADAVNAVSLVNRYGTGGSISNPKFFALLAEETFDIFQGNDTVHKTPIKLTYTAQGNNFTTDINFIPAEAGIVRMEFWLGTDDTGAKVFDEYRRYTDEEIADAINGDGTFGVPLGLGNAFALAAGTELFVRITGVPLLGNTTNPFIQTVVHPYKEIQVNGHVEFADGDDYVIFTGCDYAVDTSATTAGTTLHVPLAFRDAFTVFDSGDTFTPGKPCTVDFSAFGQGNVVLSQAKDYYKFYFDGTTWRFFDIATRGGGTV